MVERIILRRCNFCKQLCPKAIYIFFIYGMIEGMRDLLQILGEKKEEFIYGKKT